MCIYIVKICFGNANGQILSIFDRVTCLRHVHIFIRTIWLNINGFSPNLVCALILWRSGLGLLMGKFFNFWQIYQPVTHPYFCFRTITWLNLNWFSPNLICLLIMWGSDWGLLLGTFSQFLTELSPRDRIMAGYYHFTFLLQNHKISPL